MCTATNVGNDVFIGLLKDINGCAIQMLDAAVRPSIMSAYLGAQETCIVPCSELLIAVCWYYP